MVGSQSVQKSENLGNGQEALDVFRDNEEEE